MTKQFDLVIIGSGPGGYVAAIRANQLGMKVAIVEREHLGGICLNWGCIPTKALLRSAEINHLLHNLEEFGFKAEKISFDIVKIVERSRKVSKQLAAGVKHLMKKNNIEVFEGHGSIKGTGKVSVKTEKETIELTAKHIIIATGARARELPSIKVDGNKIVTYKDAMLPKTLPESLLIIGSGAIGMEFASFYSNMGSKVTVLEVQDRILPAEDEEISQMAKKIFEKQGIKILVAANLQEIKNNEKSVRATIKLKDGTIENINFDKVILAVGIVGNTENIGLENTKVKIEKSQIVTDSLMRTAHEGIYAIGDVTGAPWLAHKASHEGIICVENIAGLPVKPIKREMIPGCTYCRPQIASVGFTEKQAKELGVEVKVGRFPYIANGKAISLGETEGLIKTIFNGKTGELLGAHMIGAEVTELIQGFITAKNLEATELDLMHTIYPHPTLSEMMHEAVLDAFGKVINF
jgi:dihydrolipoamide dehydrogenase